MSDKVNFTVAQRQVLDTMDKNLLVSASAGTGKTTVMVERIKKLVLDCHAQIDRMLIVTFTKLSASEMKEKLYKVLSVCDDSFVQEQVGLIDTCSIGTIHSFCSDVIREYFYVVGIDPNFSVLKEEEAGQLFDRAMESVFEKRYRESTELFDVVEKFCGERDDGTLRNNVRRLLAFSAGIEDLPAWYEDTLKKYDDGFVRNYFNDYIINLTASLKEYLSTLCQELGEVGADTLVDRMARIREQLVATDKCGLEQNLTWLSEAKVPAKTKNMREQANFNCDYDEAERLWYLLLQAEDEVKRLISFAKELLPAVQSPQVEKTVEDFCRYNVGLAQEVQNAFSALKREKNVVDFSDMEKMTLEVLRDPLSAEQIRNRYDYVFVDEYQDVNGIQEQIIQLVAQPNALFAVGDVKQSIYGFRQADPEIFVEKEEKYSLDEQNSKVVYMNDNFRCCRDVIDFVNLTFEQAMTKTFGKVDYKATGRLVAGKDSTLNDGARGVEVVYVINEKAEKPQEEKGVYDLKGEIEEKISDGKAEGAYIANKIKELVGSTREDGTTIGYGDIVVLRRSVKGDAIDLYKQLLQEGIPAVIKLENEDCYKEINDITAFFKVLDNRYDDYSLATALVSPLGKMDFDHLAILADKGERSYLWQRLYNYAQNSHEGAKEKELAQKCRDFIALVQKYAESSAVLKMGKLLLLLFEETQYEKYVLALPNGNLRRERLLAFSTQVSGLSLQEFLTTPFNAEDFAFTNVVGDAVRIMTIHVSKGLEFDVVFLSGLDSAFSQKNKGNLVINKQRGMSAKMAEEGNLCVSLRERFVDDFNLLKQREEELRLLYVGATRAKRKLICTAVGAKKPKPYFFKPSTAKRMQDWLPDAKDSDVFEEKTISAQQLLMQEEMVESNCGQVEKAGVSQEILRYYEQAIEWQYPHSDWSALPLKVVSSKLDSDRYFKQDFEEEGEQAVFLTTETEEGEDALQDKAMPTDLPTSMQKFTVNSTDDTDKTEVGKAYHKIFEICDLYFPTVEKLTDSLVSAVAEGWITPETAEKVDLSLIKKVLDSQELKELLAGGKVYRETPFLTTLPYNQLFGEGSDREIMLQGVIDMLVIKDGQAVVVDFKITGNSAKIKERYAKQLNSYVLAVEKCLKLPARAFVLSVLDGKLVAF